MFRSLWNAASGMEAQQTNLDVITNNLANVNTTGYKRQRANFQDLMYQTMVPPGSAESLLGNQSPTGMQVGLGVRSGSVQKIFLQGSFRQTNNPLDVAIQGNGFFQVSLPDGRTAYSRDGTFSIDGKGRLVTADGLTTNPPVTIPSNAKTIHISPDGEVTVMLPGQVKPTRVGQIVLSQFVNPSGLESRGNNLFMETSASGKPQLSNPGTNGTGRLQSGFLEASNVNVAEELVNMVIGQRAYQMDATGVRTINRMLGYTATL
ncbi:MAG: flagellar basal-body rod protein FlgG [Leptospirales bacterium]